jgi:hypothetical protein
MWIAFLDVNGQIFFATCMSLEEAEELARQWLTKARKTYPLREWYASIFEAKRIEAPMEHWSFRMCEDIQPLCPSEPHGHLYRPDGAIGLMMPALTTKTQALVEIQALGELLGFSLLEQSPDMIAMEGEVAQSELPE